MVSVVIPTLNAGASFRPLLESLRRQTVPLEIVVVDSSSDDGTPEVAASCDAKVVTVQREDFDHGGTRNLGIRSASGEIIVFATQDIVPVNEHAVERLVSPFDADERVGGAYGRQLPFPGASPFAAHIRLFNYPGASCVRSLEDGGRGIKVPFLSNSFAAYRRTALQAIGCFREKLISTEDTYAGARMLLAGFRISYVADAMVYHSHNYTPWEELRRYFDIGVFHRKERWIMETFGRAEGEGRRFLRSGLLYLLQNGKYHLLPEFFVRNVLKYFGFTLGQHHDRLPPHILKKISNNKNFWANK
ncbi:MAG: glycosyltransferase [Alphaproteobacteria bacterium]|uniref:Glycosyltransferase n=1 Tax=Candidatus Nitrobium versatile TaxID=2884831 RepID=A0A953M412_9BACT|nr:glycosyltransferase [Candidatus Nitrobium versatile]